MNNCDVRIVRLIADINDPRIGRHRFPSVVSAYSSASSSSSPAREEKKKDEPVKTPAELEKIEQAKKEAEAKKESDENSAATLTFSIFAALASAAIILC
jgi:hypothetical protein